MLQCFTCLLLFAISSSLNAELKEPIAEYQVLFSPQDHIADELISLIRKEKKSVKVAVFCLMHKGITEALIQAHKRKVDVEIIVDPFSVKTRSPLKKLAAANVPIYVWNPPTLSRAYRDKKKIPKPLMHDKFCVLGNKRVWTGSFNFTYEATMQNCENVIVLENETLAQSYLEEFERLKQTGCMSYYEYVDLKYNK